MPKLQGQVTKSIKQYNNTLKKENALSLFVILTGPISSVTGFDS